MVGSTLPVPRGLTVPVEDGAEAFVEMLNCNQVDYLFLNPGTDTFPVQEAIAKFQHLGRRVPKPVLCLHEMVAGSAAHGYFMVSGRPQVVLVHVDVGTQNLGCAVHNAQRGRAGMVICAGRTPFTFEGERRGGRDSYIHWLQEQYNQAGILHDYVKWDYELRCTDSISHTVQRAFQIAASEPAGPVYMTLPREVLMEPMTEFRALPPGRYGPPAAPAADSRRLAEAAQLLVAAERPLIITSSAGRKPGGMTGLVELAELLAIPVTESRDRVNFPSEHELYMGVRTGSFLSQADVVLLVDTDVPYIPSQVSLVPDCKFIQIDIDPLKQDIPLWGFPVDVPILADSSLALPALARGVKGLIDDEGREKIARRRTSVARQHASWVDRRDSLAQEKQAHQPIAVEWLCHCLNRALPQDSIILNETVTNSGTVAEYIQRNQPGTFFQHGGSGLGWAVGAALGVKLAAPDKLVVNLTGDGSFIYSAPLAALWAADVYQTPFLTVIFNNSMYNAPKRALLQGYQDSYSEKHDRWIGIDINPPPRYQLVAESCRAYGETVTDPAEVVPAIGRALAAVARGRAAVLDVMLERP
jgi:acetolactate synthase I/II/III large subunit